jgi:hypothetical protein
MHDLFPLFGDHTHPLIHEHMSKASRCPQCRAFYTSLIVMTESTDNAPRYVITCGDCKYLGPFGINLADAVRRWNKPTGFIASLIKNWKKKRANGKPEWRVNETKKVWGHT